MSADRNLLMGVLSLQMDFVQRDALVDAMHAWSLDKKRSLGAILLERGNLMRAYERVMRNKGAPGVDGMTVADLKPYLKTHWPVLREQLREGRYRPSPVRKVEIPKLGGGKRMLGIPTVLVVVSAVWAAAYR